MVLNKKVTGKATSIPAGLAASGMVSMAVTFAVVVIGAYLISNEILPQEQIGYCSMLALMAGSIGGAVTAAWKIKHRKILVSLLSGAVYYLMLAATTALFFGGQYQGLGVTFLLIVCGCAVGAIIANCDTGKRSTIRHKKIHW